MRAELEKLIEKFEKERDAVNEFTAEIDREVASGKLTPEMAKQIVAREYAGKDPKDVIRDLNEHLASTEAMLAAQPPSHPRLRKAVPFAIVIVFAALIALNFGAITGLFTFGQDESFYALPLDSVYTGSETVPLSITDPLSSLRIDGTASGDGVAKVYLRLGDARLLVASYDSEKEGASGLTGRVTTDDTVIETLSPSEPGAVTLPASPQTDTPEVTETAPNAQSDESVAFLNACVETCSLPGLNASAALDIELSGAVEFYIERVVYGTRGEPISHALENETTETNSSNETNSSSNEIVDPVTTPPVVTPPVTPAPPIVATTNSTNESNNTTITAVPPVAPPVVIPVVPAPVPDTPEVIPGVTVALGAACTLGSQCGSGVCLTSQYHGELTGGICAASQAACVADGTVYQPGAEYTDSVCIAGTQGAAWLLRSGRGRFVVEAADGSAAAAIDKYGTMVVTGAATFSTTPGVSGWLIKDGAGIVTLSIDEQGALRSAGKLTARTTPQRTTSGDFVIRTAAGTDAAVITQVGDVLLAGSFLSGATLQ